MSRGTVLIIEPNSRQADMWRETLKNTATEGILISCPCEVPAVVAEKAPVAIAIHADVLTNDHLGQLAVFLKGFTGKVAFYGTTAPLYIVMQSGLPGMHFNATPPNVLRLSTVLEAIMPPPP